ncbi:unnamed protein product, partial [Cylicostephanus goldi]
LILKVVIVCWYKCDYYQNNSRTVSGDGDGGVVRLFMLEILVMLVVLMM